MAASVRSEDDVDIPWDFTRYSFLLYPIHPRKLRIFARLGNYYRVSYTDLTRPLHNISVSHIGLMAQVWAVASTHAIPQSVDISHVPAHAFLAYRTMPDHLCVRPRLLGEIRMCCMIPFSSREGQKRAGQACTTSVAREFARII